MSLPTPQFLNLPLSAVPYETSPVVILPVPLEKTSSYRKGTIEGPSAILKASEQVELYDAELEMESWHPGIHTLSPMNFEKINSEEALLLIEKRFGELLDDKKFPIALGGEHTLSGGTIKAAAKRFPNLCVLQIDAHADLRETYEGTPYSHACAMRLVAGDVKKIVGVGIRSIDAEEVEFAKQNSSIRIFYDHERVRRKDWVDQALGELGEDVYLTVDLDGFDPSLIPATGTPEPGGLSWYEGLHLIRTLFQKKNVVAADVVELLPLPEAHASNFIAAKLTYKLAGYWKHSSRQRC